jgi:hypothetical protein
MNDDEKILEQEDERIYVGREIERERENAEDNSVLEHHPVAWMCDYFNRLLYPHGSLIVEAELVNEIRGSFRAHAQALYDVAYRDGAESVSGPRDCRNYD